MRLRFWEPPPAPQPIVMPGSVPSIQLEARRLNRAELDDFGKAIARAVGAPDAEYTLIQAMRVGDSEPKTPTWEGVSEMVPEDRNLVILHAVGPEPPPPETPTSFQQPRSSLSLGLGDGEARPAVLGGTGLAETHMRQLEKKWQRLGSRRPTFEWTFPVLFLGAVAVALLPFIWLWAHGQLSPLLALPVAGVVWLAFIVAPPHVQARVAAHRRQRAGLDIDFGTLQDVRRKRAEKHEKRRDRMIGAGITIAVGAIGTAVTLLITSVVNRK